MRLGVIGLGGMGRRRLGILARRGQQNVLVFDPRPAALAAVAGEPGVCCSIDLLWGSKPEAVFICTPPGSHLELVEEAVARGCHVFVEKPLGNSLAGWREVVKEAESKGLTTMVGANFRYHEGIGQLKQALDWGLVGPAKDWEVTLWHRSWLPDWRPGTRWQESYSASPGEGGVILEAASHLVDLATWLVGPGRYEWSYVEAAKALGLGVDGEVDLGLTHRGGAKSTVYCDFQYRGRREMGIRVVANHGMGMEWHWRASDEDEAAFGRETEDFLRCCELGCGTNNALAEGLATLKILLKAKAGGVAGDR